MRTAQRLFVWIIGALLFASVAWPWTVEVGAGEAKTTAPPKQHQLSGSIVSSDEKTLVVRSKKGKETRFTITIETKFGPKGAIKNADDFKPGNHVQVTYVRESEGELVVKQVVPVLTRVIK